MLMILNIFNLQMPAAGQSGALAKTFEYTVPTSGANAFDIKYFYMANLSVSLKVVDV